MSKMTISRGATINLGEYESARVDVSVELEDESTFEGQDCWLKVWLEDQVDKIQSAAGLPPKAPERFTGGTE